MALAAGGRIAQNIVPDPFQKLVPDTTAASLTQWNPSRTVVFNVQLLNSVIFQQVTGLSVPPSPITAAHYAACGLPFFHMAEGETDVAGDFGNLKSVAAMDGVPDPDVNPIVLPVDMGLRASFFDAAGPESRFMSVEQLAEAVRELDSN
jgi:hypothetical protein